MWKIKVFIFSLILTFVLVLAPLSRADQLDDLQKQINDLQGKVANSQTQEKTLASQIDLINNQISLTKLKIEDTQAKLDRLSSDIVSVSGKINRLEDSLAQVSSVLANRIVETYIAGRGDPVVYILGSNDFNDLIQRLEYLRIAQKHDKSLMFQMEASRKNYHDQKDLLEDKKKQVETLSEQLKAYQADLAAQSAQKQNLLIVTRNNEARYQQLLAQAQAELSAIRNSQFSGKRSVKKGEVIGLMGSTGFSTGPHLHFGVYNISEDNANSFDYTNNNSNPFDYLSGRSINVNSDACLGGSKTSGSGGWDWPMSNPTISQCYGKTPYSYFYLNGLHAGLDMYDSNDISVRAVDDGQAYFYRGSSSLGNNVRIFHSNGKMTLYLHLQ